MVVHLTGAGAAAARAGVQARPPQSRGCLHTAQKSATLCIDARPHASAWAATPKAKLSKVVICSSFQRSLPASAF